MCAGPRRTSRGPGCTRRRRATTRSASSRWRRPRPTRFTCASASRRPARTALSEQERDLAGRVGRYFKEAGELERASDAFQLGGHFKQAAECLRTTGDYSRAAEMLITAEQPMLAAEILEEAGQEQRASQMRAEEALKKGDHEAAAHALRKAGELERAAGLYERVHRYAEAGALFEELEDFERATDLFIQAGKFGNAARCAEAADQTARAAELYEQASDFDGQIAHAAQAGRLLSRRAPAPRAPPVRRRAQGPRADRLARPAVSAQPGAAGRRICARRAATRRPTAATAPRWARARPTSRRCRCSTRWPARSRKNNDFSTARSSTTARSSSVDAHYEDAALRLKALQKRSARASQANTSGLFSASDMGGEGSPLRDHRRDCSRRHGDRLQSSDTVLGRVVALQDSGREPARQRHGREVLPARGPRRCRAEHPNIVTIFDAGEQDGEYYMAMEFVEGTTLKDSSAAPGALPSDQVRYIMINCCRALHYAHSKGNHPPRHQERQRDAHPRQDAQDHGLRAGKVPARVPEGPHPANRHAVLHVTRADHRRDIDFRSDLYSSGAWSSRRRRAPCRSSRAT